jgi:transposase-like protein
MWEYAKETKDKRKHDKRNMSRPGLKLTHIRGRNMRDVVRYSEAFKLRLVEDVTGGKYQVSMKWGTGFGKTRP